MKTADGIAAGGLFILSIVMLLESMKLVYLKEGIPGPGFAPFWYSLAMIITAGVLFVGTLLRGTSGRFFESPGGARRVLLIGICTITCIALIKPLGMLLSVGLLIAFLACSLGGIRWQTIIALLVLIPLGFYVVFERWLGVPLPIGILGL